MMTLLMWGDRHYAPEGAPVIVGHRGCDGTLTTRFTCSSCGSHLGPGDVEPRPGPGA
ncbi:hypothetical protein [Actinomadura madurae]|nr:hypothetical protein [Actinomadura madurae]MCQ0007624.1 hypothetical protein [Actinomadura madurae]